MDRHIAAFTLALLSGGLLATAQINAPDADGFIERARLMYENRNFNGAFDQSSFALKLSPDESQTEEAQFLRAQTLLREGSPSGLEAIDGFLAEFPASPKRVEMEKMRGDYYFLSRDYARALELYKRIAEGALNDDLDEELRFRQGYCYMLLGENADAARLFTSLASSRCYTDASRFYLGYIAFAEKRYDDALKLFESVDRTTSPGNCADYYLAEIYFTKSDYNKALSLAQKMIRSGSVAAFLPECNRIAGESLYNLGEESEAIPYLWKYCAETTSPQPSAFYILGVSEFREGNTDNAIKLLQQAIGTHSAMEQSAYLLLGQAYMKRGDTSSALMAFENAYKVDYDRNVSEEAFYNYAVARMDGGRVPFGNSVAMLENFLRTYPDSRYASDVQNFIVTGYMTDNDYESAIASINNIKNPSKKILKAKQRVLFVLGTRELSAGKIASAIERFRQAKSLARLDPSIAAQADLWLGDAYYRQGNYDSAIQSFNAYLNNRSADNAGNRSLAYYDLGYARFATADYRSALADFRKAASDKSGELGSHIVADARNRIGDCLYYTGDFAGAQSSYQSAYELNPEAGDYALYQTAMMNGLQKDYAGKIGTIDRLIKQYPSSGLLPAALLEKAESQSALGRSENAVATYLELVEKYPNTSHGRNGYLQLAVTRLSRGERKQAIDAYRKVISLYPTSEEARLASEDLKHIYADDGNLGEYAKFISSVKGAPAFEVSEMDDLTFQSAESDYAAKENTSRLLKYLEEFPAGRHRAQALYLLADNAWNGGDTKSALDYASKVVVDHPDSEVAEDAMLIKGEAESSLGKTESAFATYKSLETRASGAGILHKSRLGQMRASVDLGRDKEVVAIADKILASSAATPADADEVKFNRALALANLKRYDEAYKAWKELAANPGEIYGAKSAYYWGQTLLDNGQLKNALSVADDLISSNTPQSYWLARGFILYSDILRRQGKDFEANEYLKSLRSNYPGNDADIFEMIDKRLK
jgi:Uncharacterized protein conserved in bacteria